MLMFGIGVATTQLRAENWSQWRGPFFNGSSAETNLPTSWTREQNILWRRPLPGKSGATPVVWNDRVFLPSPDDQKDLHLLCVNMSDGAIRWQRKVASGDSVKGKNNAAAGSAVTDGKHVWIMFATGDLAAFDFDGKEIWHRNLAKEYGAFAYMWLYGSTPLLYQDRLYVQVLQRNPPTYPHAQDDKPERDSYLLCLNAADGKTLWRHVRPTDAIEESKESYATPIPFTFGGRQEIVLTGGNYVTGHDPLSGEELWRCGGLNQKNLNLGRVIPSATASIDHIYACGPKREVVIAVRAGGKGVVTDSHVDWRFTEFAPDVCTPLYYQGKLFVLDGDRQTMTCLNPSTGAKIWQGKLGVRETFSSSPTGADGKIYCLSEPGTVVILSAGDEFKVLATINMDEGPSMSSIVPSQGRLLIRTAQNLYCIGAKQ